MTHTMELPAATYQVLERVAHQRGDTPAAILEQLVQELDLKETLQSLRDEYQTLADTRLARTITAEERQRMKAVSKQLNHLESQTESGRIREQRLREGQAVLARGEKLLELVKQKAK